jgi:Zn-dependent alcohol dehydrogenase
MPSEHTPPVCEAGANYLCSSRPRGVTKSQAAVLKLDELITRRYRLDEINDAIKHLREGQKRRRITWQIASMA